MSELKLSPGPKLISRRWDYDEQTETGAWVDTEVTARAHEFLFDSVELDEALTLADLFGLLEAAPLLQPLFRRDFSAELLAEARLGASPAFVPGYAPDAIEYLELYQVWSFNTATLEYQPLHRLDFHGIGYALQEPLDEGHGFVYPQGHRIQWGISSANLRELLSLPVRYNPDIPVCEDDLDARQYGRELTRVRVPYVSLAQVLHGVLWELSFHGGPAQAQAFQDELNARVEDVREGTAALHPVEDLFESLDAPGCLALFDSLGTHAPREVSAALRDLADATPVQEGLALALGADLVVKPEFAALAARAFRALFREARYPATEA